MKTYLALKIYSLLKSGTQTLIGDTPAWLGRQQNRWREKYRSPRVDREIVLVQFKNIFATVCPTHQLETRTCATLDWRGLYEVAYVLSFGQKIWMNTLKIFTSQESARPGGLVFCGLASQIVSALLCGRERDQPGIQGIKATGVSSFQKISFGRDMATETCKCPLITAFSVRSGPYIAGVCFSYLCGVLHPIIRQV